MTPVSPSYQYGQYCLPTWRRDGSTPYLESCSTCGFEEFTLRAHDRTVCIELPGTTGNGDIRVCLGVAQTNSCELSLSGWIVGSAYSESPFCSDKLHAFTERALGKYVPTVEEKSRDMVNC